MAQDGASSISGTPPSLSLFGFEAHVHAPW
jgi:hypothetical protein